MTASNTKTPAPDFVRVEIGVSIGSETVMFPAPVNVIAGVPDEASNAFPDASKVSVPAVLPIVAADESVTAPVTVLLLATFKRAPEPDPDPAIVNGSDTDSPEPLNCTEPVPLTVVPVESAPNATDRFTDSTPADTVVRPE